MLKDLNLIYFFHASTVTKHGFLPNQFILLQTFQKEIYIYWSTPIISDLSSLQMRVGLEVQGHPWLLWEFKASLGYVRVCLNSQSNLPLNCDQPGIVLYT